MWMDNCFLFLKVRGGTENGTKQGITKRREGNWVSSSAESWLEPKAAAENLEKKKKKIKKVVSRCGVELKLNSAGPWTQGGGHLHGNGALTADEFQVPKARGPGGPWRGFLSGRCDRH